MDPIIERYAVTIDSLAEADRVFSMLMGDEVPRREFIEKMQFTLNICLKGVLKQLKFKKNNQINEQPNKLKIMKVTIVGAGNVGATCADAIL
jgi:hypothetical protein